MDQPPLLPPWAQSTELHVGLLCNSLKAWSCLSRRQPSGTNQYAVQSQSQSRVPRLHVFLKGSSLLIRYGWIHPVYMRSHLLSLHDGEGVLIDAQVQDVYSWAQVEQSPVHLERRVRLSLVYICTASTAFLPCSSRLTHKVLV